MILVPFLGLFIAALIYESEWRQPRKTEGPGWMHLGLLIGFIAMFVYTATFCATRSKAANGEIRTLADSN